VSSLKVGTEEEGRAELDSHADTTVIGDATALIIQDFDRPVRVAEKTEKPTLLL
jgi:hypothetical protein